MTIREFDAPASLTRPEAAPYDRAHSPVVRTAWLITRFLRRDTVRFELYEERFGRSVRSFRRDIAALRDAGIYLDSDRQGWYRMQCFRPERDAA